MDGLNSISAYFAIRFPTFTYFVKALSCTIGRRPSAANAPDLIPVHVDIDLGPLKSVSRLHARIEFDEDYDGFVMYVLGRNGAWVDGDWVRSGSRVLLHSESNVQIASRSFQFLVAPHASQTRTQSPTHESAVDVDEEMSTVSSQASVPAPPASTQTAGERAHSMEDACSAAIATYGGEASIKQITQWLNDQYDWFRRRSDSQDLVKETIMHNPLFVKVKGIRDKTSKRKAVLFTINQQYYSQHLAGTKVPSFCNHRIIIRSTSIKQETEDVDIDGVRGSPPLIISHPTQFAAAGVASPSDADEPLRPQQNPGTVSHPLRISMGDRLTKALERYSLPSSVIPPALNISLEPCHFSKKVRLPIRVGANLSGAPDAPTFKDQHIILREGELILNPKVFSDIPEDILARMSALDTEAVLEILQSEVKLYLKEQYRAVNGRGSGKYSRAQRHGRGRGRGRGRVDGHVEGAVVASPL